MTSSLDFLSRQWVAACARAINASSAYRDASLDWTHGALSLVVTPQPEIGWTETVGVWLDLERGACRAAKLITLEQAEEAPFRLTGEYRAWRSLLRGELQPVPAIMARKIRLAGSYAILMRYVRSAEELISAVTTVPTSFLAD
ncbi:MAG TPA: SCP2 sterol-binding domain-containing protein [Gemmatimonadales bacterium]|nr:SCP2 sterol-binding domain-containing protein [Gemmatimonadales bacterium]